MPRATKTQTMVTIKTTHMNDIRRFRFSVKQGEELDKLRGTIGKLYDVKKKSFTLTYIDDDDDVISISTNNDVREMIKFFGRNTIRIDVHIRSNPIVTEMLNSGEDDVQLSMSPIAVQMLSSGSSGASDDNEVDALSASSRFDLHIGVVCDGCEISPIVGTRYWCISRPGYNLCDQCHESRRYAKSFVRFRKIPYPWLFENSSRRAPHADMQYGDEGVEVLFLQKLLNDIGFFDRRECLERVAYFGKCTKDGVKKFRKHYMPNSARNGFYDSDVERKLRSVLKEKSFA